MTCHTLGNGRLLYRYFYSTFQWNIWFIYFHERFMLELFWEFAVMLLIYSSKLFFNLGPKSRSIICAVKSILKDAILLKYCKSDGYCQSYGTFPICQLKFWYDQIWTLDLKNTNLLSSPLDQEDLLIIEDIFCCIFKCRRQFFSNTGRLTV